MIHYDARGQVMNAAGNVQQQIEAINHHPLDLGHGIPTNIFQSAFSDLARNTQVRHFLKDTPGIFLALKDVRDGFGREKNDYFLIAKDYNTSAYDVCLHVDQEEADQYPWFPAA